jgi:hypothetical protein
VADAMLRFSSEIAFAAAGVYAGAAETRGAWDLRLEALVIDGLVRGDGLGLERSVSSQLAALGWRGDGPVTAVAGSAPAQRSAAAALDSVHRAARRAGFDALAGVHGGRLVVVLGGIQDALGAAKAIQAEFGAGPIVVGPKAIGVDGAASVTAEALSALKAVPAWPSAPRPVAADDLLPERTIAGDAIARAHLIESVYVPLVQGGEALLDTVVGYLDSGRALEGTARALFVHPNTVRYRLRRAADLCGYAVTEARGALTVQVALAVGRLDAADAATGRL